LSAARVPSAAVVYFGLVFGAGFLLGSVRVPFLVPRFGARVAELAEMPLMFAAIWLAAGYVVRKHGSFVSASGWALAGGVSLALLVAAELLLAVALAGRSVGEYIAGRDPVSGSVYAGMLAVFAGMPWVRHRLATHRRPRSGPGRGA